MPPIIRTTPFRRKYGHPKGSAWIVVDDAMLARGVAQIALGQWQHLAEILRAGGQMYDPPVDYAVDGAIRTLTAPEGSPDWMIAHRDGWLFQAISWIAAVEAGRGPSRPPHISHAEKGFDGLQLLLTRNQSKAKRLIVFEDKATKNPRAKVREEVWPTLARMEAGDRDQELRAELSSLLQQAPGVDPVEAVNKVLVTTTNRAYRVAITVAASHASRAGIKGLFAGYEDVVAGPRFRRRAHVLEIEDLRPWMAQLSARAIQFVEGMR